MPNPGFRLARIPQDAIPMRELVGSGPDVSSIVERVKRDGDRGVAEVAAELGDRAPRKVTRREIEAAESAIDAGAREALAAAAARIAAFARAQRAALTDLRLDLGYVEIGHRLAPLKRAGIYVPAGRHPLPSSLLMCAIPARVAGVVRVTVCTPRVTPEILVAAHITGVNEVFEIGGAQAIAALAFGTESVPRVDIVAGPGNAYVTAAKRLVYGQCGIDSLAGPSEVLIIASADADPVLVAADLLAQAEHDPMSRAMFMTDSQALAEAVDACLQLQLEQLSTAHIARASLQTNGWCLIVPLPIAAAVANRIAPEHVALHGKHAEAVAEALHAYGTLFIGERTGEVFGDYGVGPNHVLPTAGSARFSSGLSVLTFLTIRTYQRAVSSMDTSVIAQTATLASVEGLEGHRQSALYRLPKGADKPISRC